MGRRYMATATLGSTGTMPLKDIILRLQQQTSSADVQLFVNTEQKFLKCRHCLLQALPPNKKVYHISL
jgi:hypothetical protein